MPADLHFKKKEKSTGGHRIAEHSPKSLASEEEAITTITAVYGDLHCHYEKLSLNQTSVLNLADVEMMLLSCFGAYIHTNMDGAAFLSVARDSLRNLWSTFFNILCTSDVYKAFVRDH